ncbi:MAG: hypothetical protein OXR73_16285, partial [Myxococcales bacterium]|nr:hypothetical protein [Myxococcales bacterium]
GAAQDRRMWLEVVAYDERDNVVFESGRVTDREPVEKPSSDPKYDPQLALFRDWIYDAEGSPTHDFWEAAPSDAHPAGYEALTLPFAVDPAIPHWLNARFLVARYTEVARMTVRFRFRAIGLDVLTDLVGSGDLDPHVIDQLPTFTMHGAAVEWRPDEPALRSLLPDELPCSVEEER